MNSFWLPAFMLFRRELLRFWREKARVAGYVGTPFVFWLVVGAGYSDFAKFLPGSLLLAVMFSAIFSSMTLIEDRREGFLLSVLSSPAPRAAIVAGKVAGGALIAAIQGLLFYVLASLGGTLFPGANWLMLLAVVLATSFAFTAAGFLIAWRINSSQGFHAVINLIFVPLWMVSGALFRFDEANAAIDMVMRVNPVTYAQEAVRGAMGLASPEAVVPPAVALGIVCLTAVVLWVAATLEVNRPSERSLS